ncbi:MAG: hypothetical protein EKD82_18145 [Candidatus Symbiopectobacterium sp. PLON1]|nr:hypothetical protein [Candidatus Symbiopectobacterium sp. PLON1]
MKKLIRKHFIREVKMDKSPAKTTLELFFGVENYQNLLDSISSNTFYKCQLQNVVSELLTLPEFQNIINTRRLPFPRCRLVRSGNPLSPVDYNERCHSALGEGIIKLVSERVMQELSNGATLVVDFTEDLSLKIRSIAEALSTEFQEKTGATVFFSIGHDKGFTTHWDNSNTLVFQLSGRKKWNVFTTTLPFPVDENKKNMKPPSMRTYGKFHSQ